MTTGRAAAAWTCRDVHGRTVQVDRMKPTVKAPGAKRLKLKYDGTLSSFVSNLRRYSMVGNG